QQTFFVSKRLHRVKVEAHDPRIGQMRPRRNQVRNKVRLLPFGLDADALEVPGVAGDDFQADSGDDLLVSLEQFRLCLSRAKEFRQIARSVTVVRMERVFPLSALHEVAGARKSRHESRPFTPGVPSAVVKVEVRVDDDMNVLGVESQLLKLHRQRRRVADAIEIGAFGVKFVADAGLNQDVSIAGSDEQARQAHPDAVSLVCRKWLLPERFGHHAENLAAIQGKSAVRNGPELECAEFHRSSTSSIKTPAVLDGCMKA